MHFIFCVDPSCLFDCCILIPWYSFVILIVSIRKGKKALRNTMPDADFEIRSKQFNIATDESIREALQLSGTIILDVRTHEEIFRDGRNTEVESFPADRLTYIQSECTVDDCVALRESPGEVVPNLTANTSTIVIHCATGRRAAFAKELLIQRGDLGTILNGGGYKDMKKFF
jgi:rhodanese-related sulfurtransferase